MLRRWVLVLWCLPSALAALGLLVFARVVGGPGATFLVPGRFGWRGWFNRRAGDRVFGKRWAGVALPPVAFLASGMGRSVAYHEQAHLVQGAWLGPMFLPTYGFLWLFGLARYRSMARAYAEHPMERAARAATADRLAADADFWGRVAPRSD